MSDDLRGLLEHSGDRATSIGEMLIALGERGTAVLIILMAAPFVLPIPLPGLSIPFGIAIAVLGLRLGFRRSPWLPGFLLRRPIQPSTLAALVRSVAKVTRPIERMMRPRWAFMSGRELHLLTGFAIAMAAVMIMPPIPVPGFNAIPAMAIVLFAFGLMEEDGWAVLGGYFVLLVACAYVYIWWDVVVRVVRQATAV